MDWDDLKFVLVIARSGSLSGAGRELKLNQTTVSRHLTALEQRLGVRLFIRSHRSFIPTDAGETVITRAERMETEALSVVERLNYRDFRPQGFVRIATMPWIITSLIIPALPEFSARYPGIEIETIAEVRERSLSKREAELALRFEMEPRGRERAITIATITYALYAPAGPDVDELPWIAFGEDVANSVPAKWIEQACSASDRVSLRTHDVGFIHVAIRAGAGKGLIPELLGDEDPNLVRLSGPDPEMVRHLRVMVHEDMRQMTRTVTVIEWLEDVIDRRVSKSA